MFGKVYIPDQILAEWFVKSLLPKITEDVAKASVVTEKKVIAQAQYHDLVYMQSSTLHEKILDLPKQGQIAAAPSGSHVADGMIGTVSSKSKKKSSNNSSPIITLPDSPKGESSQEVSADIHVVETSTTKSKSGGKKKGRNKKKRIRKRKQIKMNPMTKNVNLAILVSFVNKIISRKNFHIETKLRNSLKDRNNLLS